MEEKVKEGQGQMRFWNPVFIISLIICIVIAVWAVVFNLLYNVADHYIEKSKRLSAVFRKK